VVKVTRTGHISKMYNKTEYDFKTSRYLEGDAFSISSPKIMHLNTKKP